MKKFLIIFAILAALGIGLWFYLKSRKVGSKKEAIKIIASYTGAGEAAYEAMGESYLISRATAIKQGSETFKDAGNTYVTKTGRSA